MLENGGSELYFQLKNEKQHPYGRKWCQKCYENDRQKKERAAKSAAKEQRHGGVNEGPQNEDEINREDTVEEATEMADEKGKKLSNERVRHDITSDISCFQCWGDCVMRSVLPAEGRGETG